MGQMSCCTSIPSEPAQPLSKADKQAKRTTEKQRQCVEEVVEMAKDKDEKRLPSERAPVQRQLTEIRETMTTGNAVVHLTMTEGTDYSYLIQLIKGL